MFSNKFVIFNFFIMLYLVSVVILSFMNITCTNTMFHFCQGSRDSSFLFLFRYHDPLSSCTYLHYRNIN